MAVWSKVWKEKCSRLSAKGLTSRGSSASTRRHNNYSIELKVKTATWPLWAPHASWSTGKEGISVLAGVINPDYQGEIVLQFHSGGKECRRPLWVSLRITMPPVGSMGNYHNLIQAELLMSLTLQECRFGSLHQVKNHGHLRCSLKAKGIQNGLKWVGTYEYQLWSHD